MTGNPVTVPVFYHTLEDHVVIGNTNLIWSHNLSEAGANSVVPLLSSEDMQKRNDYSQVYGICSDFVGSAQ